MSERIKKMNFGVVKWFLGINVFHTYNVVYMIQTSYVDMLLQIFRQIDAKSKPAPLTGGEYRKMMYYVDQIDG